MFERECKRPRKVNGNMVDLAEVERALVMDEEVAEARVSLDGGSLLARVAVARGVDLDEKSRFLRGSLRGLLAEYKIPRRIALLS